MRIRTRLLAWLLVTAMCLSFVPATAWAAEVSKSGNETVWAKVDWDSITENDLIAIVISSSSASWTLSNSKAASAPSAIEVQISGGILKLEDSAGYVWTISDADDGKYIKNANGDFLYTTAANNGTRINSSPSSGQTWSLEDGYLKATDSAGDARYLCVYNSQDWRCYKSGSKVTGQEVSFWKLVSIPEETQVKEPTAIPASGSTVVPGTTVNLSCSTTGATIQYKQTAPAADTDWTEGTSFTLDQEGSYTYEVKAAKTGLEESDTVTLTYIVKAAAIEDISAALAGEKGTTFTVKGVVTMVDGRNIYIQDETGGICAYFGTAPSDISLGDTIIVTGSKTTYSGLPELEITGTEHQKIEDGKLDLTAKTKTISAITLADLCTYVKVVDAKVTAISGTSVTIEDSTGSIQIYKTVMPSGLAVGNTVTVSAAVGVYSNNPQLRNTLANEIDITGKGTTDPGNEPDEPGDTDSVWTKTTLDAIQSGNKVAITMTTSDATYILPSATTGSSSKPSAVTVTVSGDTLITEGSSALYAWYIDASGDGYYITNEDGSYLYTTASDNAAYVGTTSMLWSLSDGYLKATGDDWTRSLGVYNKTDWRTYKDSNGTVGNNIKGQTVNFWALTTEGADPEPEAPVDPGYEPMSGDRVVIFYPGESKVMTGTASGTRLKGADATASGDNLYTDGTELVLTVKVEDGIYTFTSKEGKVLNTATNGQTLTLVDASAVTASKWKLEKDEVNGGWRIMSTEAQYNGNYNQGIEYYGGNFTTYGYKAGDKIFTMRFYKAENCKSEPQTDSNVVDNIAQWGGGGPYDSAQATMIQGDLFESGDMLDANAKFTARANGVDAQPYQRTTGSGSTPESPNYNYYMGAENVGAKSGDYMQFAVSSYGYGDMELSFRLRVTKAGAKDYTLQYSADGGSNWGTFANGTYSYAYHDYGSDKDVTSSGKITNGVASIPIDSQYISYAFEVPVGAENVENLLVRLVPGDARVSGTGNISGNVRIDSVKLTGSPIINDNSIVGYVTVDPDGREEDVPGGTALTMTTASSGATIKYRFVDPKTGVAKGNWATYSPTNKPLLPTELPVALEVYAESGSSKSVTRRFLYNAGTVEAVKMDPNGGGVYLGTEGRATITLSTNTTGAAIWYRTNKMTTDADGDGNVDFVRYTTPIELTTGFGTLTVEAYATYPGLANSAVTTRTFTERSQATYSLYFGQMHSHTAYSDGAGTAAEAFNSVKALSQEQWNMDFLSVTDHSNSFDDAGGSKTINDKPTGTEWNQGKQLAAAATDKNFVGIFGYEMTWSNGLGHINTFNTNGYQDRTQSAYTTYSTALQNYYDMLKTASNSISQFNHPGTTFGDFSDFAHYDEEIDQLITLIEVGNGEGAIGSSGYFPSYEYYTRALDKGWHVAPTNNQDNHKGGWGTANTGRDVVLVDELTEEAIYDAMRNYRVYATEDLNLEIYYTLDGNIMGSILDKSDVGDTAAISVSLSDPNDSGDATVEVIVNGGLSLASTKAACNGTVTFNVPTTYNYYYIKITQADGDIAVTAPVWIGSVEAVGVSSFTAENAITVVNQRQTFNLELYNNEKKSFEVSSIEFTIKETGQKIGEATDITVVKKMDTAETSFSYTFKTDGIYTITATIKGTLDGMAKTYTQDLSLTVMPAEIVTKILVDGTHYNDYVTGYYGGRMGNMTTIAANNGVQVEIVTDNITKERLADCSLLVLSAPAKKSGSDNAGAYTPSTYSNEFMSMVAEYVRNGGTVIVCGLADYQDDKSSAATPYHSSVQQNALLAAIGSSMTINDDEAYDEVNNGGQEYRLYPAVFNMDSEWTKGIITDDNLPEEYDAGQTYSQYSGCTVNPGNGTWLVKGFDTTYSIDSDKDGKGGVEKGKAYFLAYEEVGAGKVFVAGGVFVSDFEVAAELDNIWDLPYANRTIYENILNNICAPKKVTPIADTRKAELNKVFVIEGYVTSGTTNPSTTFFDAIYVQDDTGGTTCFPYATEGLSIGTKVRILGYTDAYQDDREIQIISLTVLDDKPYVYQPKELTTKQAADYDTYGGQLIKTTGTVSRIIMASGRVSQFDLTDSTGVAATVFMDGYIWNEAGKDPVTSWLKEGQTVSAVGLLYKHPEGDSEESVAVLRVRNCDEITKIADAPTSGGDTPGGSDTPGSSDTPSGGGSGSGSNRPSGGGNSSGSGSKPSGSGTDNTGSNTGTGNTSNTKPVNTPATAPKNGTVKTDVSNAAKGEAVTVEPIPDEGFITGNVIITDEDGNTIVVVNEGNGVYSFIMPGTGVTVNAEFVTPGMLYSDLDDNQWYRNSVAFAVNRGLMMGVGDGKFAPNETTTRGMVATILYRLANEPAANLANFKDVPSNEYYAKAVAWANENGVVKGYNDGTFAPNDFVTREQLVVMLWRYAGEPASAASLAAFPDANGVSDWARTAMAWAVENGIINGNNGKLLSGNNATRVEITAMIMRYCKNIEA